MNLFGLLKLMFNWRELKRAIARERKMNEKFDPRITFFKSFRELIVSLLSICGLAVLAALADPEFLPRVLEGTVPPAILAPLTAIIVALATAGRNWFKNKDKGKEQEHDLPEPVVDDSEPAKPGFSQPRYDGTFKLWIVLDPDMREHHGYTPAEARRKAEEFYELLQKAKAKANGKLGVLVLWLLLAPAASAQLDYGLWVTKSVTFTEGERDDYFGGRAHLRYAVAKGFAVVGRADVVTVSGANPFKDLGSAKAIDAYLGVEYILLNRKGFLVGPLVAYGESFPIAQEPGDLRETQSLAGAGAVLHHKSGAFALVLLGKYDAAGPGTRVLMSGHAPIKAGFSFLADYVSGAGGWTRLGAAYKVSF